MSISTVITQPHTPSFAYVLGSLCILLTLTGCAAKETAHSANPPTPTGGNETSDAQFIQKLEQLNSKNPVMDAQSSIAAGKKYFLCNIGRSRTVPGLETEEYASARENCTTQCLDGVTDAVIGDNHLRYLQAATAYSASWNKVMINVCR